MHLPGFVVGIGDVLPSNNLFILNNMRITSIPCSSANGRVHTSVSESLSLRTAWTVLFIAGKFFLI